MSDNAWLDDLLDTQVASDVSEQRLDYALHLLANTPWRVDESVEIDLVDRYLDMSAVEWDELFVMLRLNQLRCVDNYSYTQRQLSRWIRLIAFHEL